MYRSSYHMVNHNAVVSNHKGFCNPVAALDDDGIFLDRSAHCAARRRDNRLSRPASMAWRLKQGHLSSPRPMRSVRRMHSKFARCSWIFLLGLSLLDDLPKGASILAFVAQERLLAQPRRSPRECSTSRMSRQNPNNLAQTDPEVWSECIFYVRMFG